MSNLTNAEMQAIINGGGSVKYRGRLITDVNDLPSDDEIALDFAPEGADAFTPLGDLSDGLAIGSAQTLTRPADATKLLIQSLGKNARFTLDGTTPTASKGFQLKADDPAVIIPVGAATVVKVIEEEATADLQFQWGK